jgi:hypothetical protein
MKRLALLVACTACRPGTTPRAPADEIVAPSGTLAGDEAYRPDYGRDELERALTHERGAEASAEVHVRELEARGDDDQLRRAVADLAVRRRFIASLEACQATGEVCPPRLDDPPWTFAIDGDAPPRLDTPLRFDLATWRTLAAELHGRACACRTLSCVDSMFVAIEQLETRPMPDVQGDEDASRSVTRARECLYRLRGLRPTPRAVATQ